MATCAETDWKFRLCECGKKETEIISVTEHTAGEWIIDTDPACEKEGSKHQVCSACGATIKTESIAAKGHTAGKWITDAEATCTEKGNKHQVCSVCSQTIKTEEIAAKGHVDGKWITDQEATCTEKGSKHQVCSTCGATIKTESIAAKGHTAGKWITDKEATCTEKGSKHQVCSTCGATIKTESIAAKGHTAGKWITDKEATCTEKGSKHQVCSTCGVTIKTESIAAKGHTYSTKYQPATEKTSECILHICECGDQYSTPVDPISITIRETGYSSFNSFKKSVSFSIGANGGYGDLWYKYEVFASESSTRAIEACTVDFCQQTTYGFQSALTVNDMVLQVTVRDDFGHENTSRWTVQPADFTVIDSAVFR